MATTVTGTAITFTNGTSQDTGSYVYLDTQGAASNPTSAQMQLTNYAVGHYLLIENQSKGSYTVACPLNGWDASIYAAPVFVYSQAYSSPTAAVITQGASSGSGYGYVYQRAATGGSFTISGTWKNRGGNLVGFLVQRVA